MHMTGKTICVCAHECNRTSVKDTEWMHFISDEGRSSLTGRSASENKQQKPHQAERLKGH